MARRKQLKYNKKLLLPAAIVVAALVIAIIAIAIFYPELFDILFKGSPERPLSDGEPALEVHIMDVGQGDSIIVRLPDGKNMLIDAGTGGGATKTKDGQPAGEKALEYIDNLGIETFDYMMLTHSDQDHCSFMDDIIKAVSVKEFFVPKLTHSRPKEGGQIDTVVFDDTMNAVKAEPNSKINYNIGVFTISEPNAEYTITAYCFPEEYYKSFKTPEENSEKINSVSPIVIIEYGGREFMFTGDAVGDTDENFMKLTEGKDIDVDFLKVAHHGSSTNGSNSLDFLSYIDPEYAFISAGVGNDYGHPSETILNRLADYEDIGLDMADDDYDGIYETKITAQSGDLVIVIGKSGGFNVGASSARPRVLRLRASTARPYTSVNWLLYNSL